MRLSDAEYDQLDQLSRVFIDGFRTRFPAVTADEQFTDRLEVTVAAAVPEVGPLRIMLDGDEITIFVGDWTHCHFSVFMSAAGAVTEVCTHALDFVADLLADRVVIWAYSENGRRRRDGTYPLGAPPRWAIGGAAQILWSGREP